MAMVLLKVWGDRLGHIEDKMTRVIVLLSLSLEGQIGAAKITNILNEKELKVIQELK